MFMILFVNFDLARKKNASNVSVLFSSKKKQPQLLCLFLSLY